MLINYNYNTDINTSSTHCPLRTRPLHPFQIGAVKTPKKTTDKKLVAMEEDKPLMPRPSYYMIACPYTSPYIRVRWGSLGPTLIRSIHVLARDRARKMYPRRMTQSAQEPARA
jgi:hypothetical protein